eukprot:scaffold24382_cov33-Tisochrysis_lutea.AAC.1
MARRAEETSIAQSSTGLGVGKVQPAARRNTRWLNTLGNIARGRITDHRAKGHRRRTRTPAECECEIEVEAGKKSKKIKASSGAIP